MTTEGTSTFSMCTFYTCRYNSIEVPHHCKHYVGLIQTKSYFGKNISVG